MVRNVPVAIILVLGIFLGSHYAHRPTQGRPPATKQQSHLLQNNVLATGTVNALETVQVGSQVSGIVQAVYADYNTKVHRGQILALIDPGPFETQLSQAQAQLERARAQDKAAHVELDEARAEVVIAQDQTAAQRRSAEIATSEENLAKLTLDHDEAQAKFGVTSDDAVRSDEATVNLADFDRQIAEAATESTQLTIAEKQAEIRQAEAEIIVADAQVRQDEAAVTSAKVSLDRTEIRAPIDGTVLDRTVTGGETVVASSVAPTLFQIIPDTGKMQVDVDLSESDISQVYPGQSAMFTVDALPGRTLHAIVRQVRKQAVNVDNVISFDVVMDVVDPPAQLFPGMTAVVTIPVAKPVNSSTGTRS
jgi:HlyD family secretion protein